MVDFMLLEFYHNWKKKKKLGQTPVCTEKWAGALEKSLTEMRSRKENHIRNGFGYTKSRNCFNNSLNI